LLESNNELTGRETEDKSLKEQGKREKNQKAIHDLNKEITRLD